MIEIRTPDHGTFEAANEWKDLTLRQFEELAHLEVPEKLRDLWIAASKGTEEEYEKIADSISSAEHMGPHADYFRSVMELLTTMPAKLLKITEWTLVTDFYYEYLHQFVISTFYQVPQIKSDKGMVALEPKKIDYFKYRDTKYYLPKSLHVFQNEIPMGEEKIAAFAEASDIEIAFKDLEEKGVRKFAVIVGIYCREKGQEYDQKQALQRAEAFRNLDMETVWSVFFCITELYRQSTNGINQYLKRPEDLINKRRAGIVTWTTSTIEG